MPELMGVSPDGGLGSPKWVSLQILSYLILSYAKLESLGFGGRVKTLILSMYYNDCVRVCIAGSLSAPLWFTKGVKQGCILSPLLFALYISGLGAVLHVMKRSQF